MLQYITTTAFELLRRQADEVDPDDPPEAGQKEIFSSWALFILIMLLITALLTSYILQQKKIQAVHETVISIFAGKGQILGGNEVWTIETDEERRYGCWLDHQSHSRTVDTG